MYESRSERGKWKKCHHRELKLKTSIVTDIFEPQKKHEPNQCVINRDELLSDSPLWSNITVNYDWSFNAGGSEQQAFYQFGDCYLLSAGKSLRKAPENPVMSPLLFSLLEDACMISVTPLCWWHHQHFTCISYFDKATSRATQHIPGAGTP